MKIITDETSIINKVLDNFPGVNLNVTPMIESFLDDSVDVVITHVRKDHELSEELLDFLKPRDKHLLYVENPAWLEQLKVIANCLHQEYINEKNDKIIDVES